MGSLRRTHKARPGSAGKSTGTCRRPRPPSTPSSSCLQTATRTRAPTPQQPSRRLASTRPLTRAPPAPLPLPAVGAGLPADGRGVGLPGPGSGGGGWGGGGWGTAVSAMAVNLSRNGPALQEAYEQVVNEKSPTDWWAPRRPGAGRGRAGSGLGPGSQGARSPVCPAPAPHPGGVAVPTLSPLAPPCVGRLNPAWGWGSGESPDLSLHWPPVSAVRASLMHPVPGCA